MNELTIKRLSKAAARERERSALFVRGSGSLISMAELAGQGLDPQ
jgi:hypothetical protein